ncbi:25S rRNA (uracil2634-N3)-methyltransferase [Sarracenia purpurea var. burkii]
MELEVLGNENKEERRIVHYMHYSSSHKILLVGEGDFSFAACLAIEFGSASNIIATSLDSKANLKRLERLGGTVLHGVDVGTMTQDTRLNSNLFDRIVFNFPHAGFGYRHSEYSEDRILLHRELVRRFLSSARDMLASKGEVHVTHKTTYPYEWEVEKLAKVEGLRLVEEAFFSIYHYPGYQNKKGDGSRSDDSFPVGQCSTFKFAKSDV